MSTAREILRIKGGEVWSINPDASILQAIERMAEQFEPAERPNSDLTQTTK